MSGEERAEVPAVRALDQGSSGDLDPDSLTGFWVTPEREPASPVGCDFLRTAVQDGYGTGVLRFSPSHTALPLSSVGQVTGVARTPPRGSVPTLGIDQPCRSVWPPPPNPLRPQVIGSLTSQLSWGKEKHLGVLSFSQNRSRRHPPEWVNHKIQNVSETLGREIRRAGTPEGPIARVQSCVPTCFSATGNDCFKATPPL